MSDLSPLCAQLRTLLVGLHHRSRANFRRLPCVSLRSGLNGQRHQQTSFPDLVGRRREGTRSDPRAHSGREARPRVAMSVQRRPPAFRVRYRRRGQRPALCLERSGAARYRSRAATARQGQDPPRNGVTSSLRRRDRSYVGFSEIACANCTDQNSTSRWYAEILDLAAVGSNGFYLREKIFYLAYLPTID
jgi:hypothetical protein